MNIEVVHEALRLSFLKSQLHLRLRALFTSVPCAVGLFTTGLLLSIVGIRSHSTYLTQLRFLEIQNENQAEVKRLLSALRLSSPTQDTRNPGRLRKELPVFALNPTRCDWDLFAVSQT
jgi:hypothetical protein